MDLPVRPRLGSALSIAISESPAQTQCGFVRCVAGYVGCTQSALSSKRGSSSAAPVPSRTSADLGSSHERDGSLRNFPHPIGEIPQGAPAALAGVLENPRLSRGWIPRQAGAALALRDGEHPVFRAALFSIVLTLAVGQNAALLCEVWCQDATSAGCLHQGSTTSPSVSADDSCSRVVVGAVVGSVREDARRTAAAPDAQNALVLPRFRLVPSPTDRRSGFEAGWRQLPEERPLILALRI